MIPTHRYYSFHPIKEDRMYNYPFRIVSEEFQLAIWEKGQPAQGYSPDIWRYDICGTPMKYSEHGNIDSEHGWEINHIKPISKGGLSSLENLQPLQWENNRQKGG